MDRSNDWQFRLGPLRLQLRVRSLGLSDAFPELALPPSLPAALALPRPGARAAGPVRPSDDGLLSWESEGGRVS